MDEEIEKLMGYKKIPLKVLIKRILHYIKPEIVWFLFALVLVLVNIVVEISIPYIESKVTDQLLLTDINIKFIIDLVIIMTLIYIANQGFLYVESMILQKCGQRIIYRLRIEVFDHIENMSVNQLNNMPVGSLVTRVCNYTASLSDLFTSVLVQILRNILMIIGTYSLMIFISFKLSMVLIVILVSFVFAKYIRKVFTKERGYISDLNTFLSENIAGMKLTQIFNQQASKIEEFDQKNDNLRNARFAITKAFGIYRPLVSFIYTCSIAITFLMGFKFNLTGGQIVGFYLYLSRFFNPIQNLADQLNQIQRALTACERLFNLLDVAPDVVDKEDAISVDSFKGHIEFKHVWFAYKEEEWILKDVSLEILPGQTVAFVGATGAGKTTILSLIVRNYKVNRGEILIDGININDLKIECLRKAVGQMLQDVFLFSGTIKSNVTLKDDSFKDQEVIEALEYVNANSFVSKLPSGINEPIIERGENLSSGQRQLLSFARTVIHRPQILILDEATANIDTQTEVLIQESLEKMKSIGTMLVVAHRLSTIQHSDQIIVLQNGQVVEKGTHHQLLDNKGYYYKLYQIQFEN